MYHTEQINQVKQKDKSYSTTTVLLNNLQTDYTPTFQRVLKELLEFVNASYICVRNDYLALRAGCSNNTVTRATNQFLKDGLITKHQKNKYAPNRYTFTHKVKKITFSHWINSLSPHNQYLYNTHGIRIDHKNKIFCSFEYGEQNKSSLILDNLFINLSPSSRMREGKIFKKIKDPQKGMSMYDYQNKQFVIAKPQEKKRNTGGHSPAVAKPVIPLDDQIHTKKVDIAFFKVQLESPETFWDPRSILFATNVSMARSLLNRAEHQLKELEAQKNNGENKPGSNNEKQSVLREYTAYSMATCSA